MFGRPENIVENHGHANPAAEMASETLLFGGKVSRKRRAASIGLFYVAYGVWLIWKLISISMLSFPEGSRANTLLHLIVYAAATLSIIAYCRLDKEIAYAAIGLCLGVAVKHFSGDIVIVDLVLLLFASRNCTFQSIVKFTLALTGLGIITIVTLSQTGVILDYPFPRSGSEIVRHGLGFRYCTYLGHLYLNIVMMYIYLRREKISIPACATILLIDIIIFMLTDSRNSFALVVLTVVGSLILRRHSNRPALLKILAPLAKWSFVALFILGLICALAYDSSNKLWSQVNSITSNRIAQDSASIDKYGVTPFGREVEFAGNSLIMGGSTEQNKDANPDADRNVIESSFLNLLVVKGAVSLVAVLVVIAHAASTAEKQGDVWMLAILCVIAAHSMFDPQLIDLLYNTFLFWIWKSLMADTGPRLLSDEANSGLGATTR